MVVHTSVFSHRGSCSCSVFGSTFNVPGSAFAKRMPEPNLKLNTNGEPSTRKGELP